MDDAILQIFRKCRFCGDPTPPGQLCPKPDCKRQGEAIALETEAMAQRVKSATSRKRFIDSFRAAGLIESQLNTRFADLLVDQDNENAVNLSYEFAQRFGKDGYKPRALYLTGKPGTGKTRLSYAVIAILLERCKCGYYCCRDGLRPFYPPHDAPAKERQEAHHRLNEFQAAQMVIVDDLGYEGTTPPDKFLEFLNGLVDRQYRQNRGLIVTAEHRFSQIESRYGDSAASLKDRIREMTVTGALCLGGISWRELDPIFNRPVRENKARKFGGEK